MTSSLEELLPLLSRISANREMRVSLAELASEASKSPSHFQRTFARRVGESPKQFTRRLQLECGAALLVSTEDSVLDVALRCGFDSHEGFTRAFRRQFGRSPKSFRQLGARTKSADKVRHAQIVSSVGPCLQLFRISISTPQAPDTMNYDITQQRIEPWTLLYRQTRTERAKLAEALAKVLPAAYGHAMKEGITMTGPPTCRYLDWGPAMVTIEAGVPVACGTPGTQEVQVATFEATEAAVAMHTGSYDGLGDAHAALELYLHEHCLEASDAPYEVYLTDPGEVPDPAEWKTQIVWPFRRPKTGRRSFSL